jgi:hypothetical protein
LRADSKNFGGRAEPTSFSNRFFDCFHEHNY